MAWFKPRPFDESPPPNSLRASGRLSNSVDDDSAHVHPMVRQWNRNGAPNVPTLIPGVSTLDGPRFRVGYFQYVGLPPGGRSFMNESEGDAVIGMPVVIRPPLIPRRAATVQGVRDAIIWVQSMPYAAWPMYNPPTVRR